MRFAVIMAGGAGTRLWPLSRRGMPKQLLTLIDDTSLLRMSYDRLAGVVDAERILVCAARDYADEVARILPELPAENILGEPMGRDSLNAVAWSSAVVASRDPEATLAVVTADHIIEPVAEFADTLRRGFALAEADERALVTFGVVPTAPATGYGYLQRGDDIPGHPGASAVRQFKEKPDAATAQQYLDSGAYWWNSGMFVWRAATVLSQLKYLRPDTRAAVAALVAEPSRLDEIYPTLEKISVDYALMEPTSAGEGDAYVVAVPLAATWHDVGDFAALAAVLADGDADAVDGAVATLDCEGNLLLNRGADGHLLATVGLRDHIVVHTSQVTLVCPRHDSQRIKELVANVVATRGQDYA